MNLLMFTDSSTDTEMDRKALPPQKKVSHVTSHVSHVTCPMIMMYLFGIFCL